jgi:hypothetical protein
MFTVLLGNAFKHRYERRADCATEPHRVPNGRDEAGNLYGTTCAGAYGDGVAFKLSTKGKETLYGFSGGKSGQTPYRGLIRDAQGTFYGPTL